MLDVLICMQRMGHPVESILHVGANEGQERHDYHQSGASPCIYIEPVEAVFGKLQENLKDMPYHRAVQALCLDVAGEEILFNVASNDGQSSSILALGSHAEFHPSITYTNVQPIIATTIDRLIAEHCPKRVPNVLVVDAQGADLRVLKGARRSLPHVDAVFIEVSESPLYEGGCTFREITNFLEDFGLHLRWVTLDSNGHGEAFYYRPKLKIDAWPIYGGNIALGKPATQSSLCEWSYFFKAEGPSGAVNGKLTGFFGFHTDVEDHAWWQVDLEAIQPLNEIRIFNRMDAGRERSRSLQILLSDDGDAWRVIHDQAGYTFGGADERPLRVMTTGMSARFVRLRLQEHAPLHLDQVQIY